VSYFYKLAITAIGDFSKYKFNVNQDYLRLQNRKSERYDDMPRNYIRISNRNFIKKAPILLRREFRS